MAPKSKRETKHKPRLFLESKAKRIMEGLGWDFAKFVGAYEEEPARRGPKTRLPTPEETRAVEHFLKSGDFSALKKALGTSNIQTANAAVARVMAAKAQRKVHEASA